MYMSRFVHCMSSCVHRGNRAFSIIHNVEDVKFEEVENLANRILSLNMLESAKLATILEVFSL